MTVRCICSSYIWCLAKNKLSRVMHFFHQMLFGFARARESQTYAFMTSKVILKKKNKHNTIWLLENFKILFCDCDATEFNWFRDCKLLNLSKELKDFKYFKDCKSPNPRNLWDLWILWIIKRFSRFQRLQRLQMLQKF